MSQLAEAQLALHNNYKAQLATLAAATKRFTGAEFKVTSEAGTQSNIQPKANLEMLSADMGLTRQLQSLAGDWNHAQTVVGADGSRWVNPVSFRTAWTEENPLSRFIDTTRKELAPAIRGVPAAPAAAAGGVPVISDPSGLSALQPGDRYARPGDPAGSWRTVPRR
jgi:hypothetical protein